MNHNNAPVTWGVKDCVRKIKTFRYTELGITVADKLYIAPIKELVCSACNNSPCFSDSAIRKLLSRNPGVIPLKYISVDFISPEKFEELVKDYVKSRIKI